MNNSKSNSKANNSSFVSMDTTDSQNGNLNRLEGVLHKYTNVMKGWQFRWFVVDGMKGVLEYYMPDDKKKDQPRGRILLVGCIVAPSEEDSQTFTVSASNGDVFKLKATDVRQRQLWVDRLRQVAQQQDNRATLVAHQNDRLNDLRESLFTAQKAQTKLTTGIESFTHSDEKLLLLKATSHGSLMALEQSFAILQSINESQTLQRSA